MDEKEKKNDDIEYSKDNGFPYPMVGKSRHIDLLTKQVSKLSKTRADVRIQGEAGVGKGAVAKNIYHLAQTSNVKEPLFTIKLSTIDDKELDEILFGSEVGEKLSDVSRHELLDSAKGGTILLEEIEEASLRNQMKILNMLNERSLRQYNIRFIITMKDDPQVLRGKRKLLEDLYNKMLNFEVVVIPPLRERPEDIPVLVRHFASELCEQLGMADLVIDINALDVLVRQPWKENIRELKAIVDKSVLFSNSGRFMLPPELVDEKTEVVKMISNIEMGTGFALEQSLDLIEKGIIERSLQKFGHNQSRAALFLGLTEQTLRYKLKRLGIISSRIVKNKFSQ